MPGMTRDIVLTHDGTIGLENLEHGGLRAWVRLPSGTPAN